MTTITNNLLAFYKLDNTADSSSNNRTLTNLGDTTFTAGKIGNAAVFDGTDKVLKSESISVAGSSELTFSFWIKTSNFSQPGCNLVGIWGNSNSSDTQFEAYYDSAGVYGLIQTPSGQGDRGMIAPPTRLSLTQNNWHHFVMVFKDGNKVYGIYDGVKTQVTNFNYTTISNNSAYFGIGRTSQTAWGGANHFAGQIDAVGVWNRALSDAEAAAIYNSGRGGEVIEGVWTPVDPYLIDGVETTLNENGTGIWNNQLYINGAVNNTYNGWLAEISTYFIIGVATTLNENGTGAWNNSYYINETQTTLSLGGYGMFNGEFYAAGSLSPNFTGFDSVGSVYYINEQATTLDQNGNGELEGLYYFNGTIANGWDWSNWSGYYIQGVLTTLNVEGFGTWNDVFYANGSPNANYTGPDWWDYVFYINSELTTLDIDGNGTWQGKVYENGSLFSGSKYGLTFVDGIAQPVNVATEVGTDVPVTFGLNDQSEPLVQLVFAGITSAGETTVEQIVPTVLPTGYTVAETLLAYSIDTTATFTGTINVDFILPSNISQTVFNRCKAFHVKNSGAIEEMTRVSSDFATKKITVAITSFSSFLFLDEPQQTGGKLVKIQGKSKFYGKVKFGV